MISARYEISKRMILLVKKENKSRKIKTVSGFHSTFTAPN